MTDMEEREVWFDWLAELPSGLWHLGFRTLKLRTHALVRGTEGTSGFIIAQVLRVLRHEVEPEGWQLPPTPREVANR